MLRFNFTIKVIFFTCEVFALTNSSFTLWRAASIAKCLHWISLVYHFRSWNKIRVLKTTVKPNNKKDFIPQSRPLSWLNFLLICAYCLLIQRLVMPKVFQGSCCCCWLVMKYEFVRDFKIMSLTKGKKVLGNLEGQSLFYRIITPMFRGTSTLSSCFPAVYYFNYN